MNAHVHPASADILRTAGGQPTTAKLTMADLREAIGRYIGYIERADTAVAAMAIVGVDEDTAVRAAGQVIAAELERTASNSRFNAQYCDSSIGRLRDEEDAYDRSQAAKRVRKLIRVEAAA